MKQNDHARQFLKEFLEGSEITDDLRNTLDNLVIDKLEYHLLSSLDQGADCASVLQDLANIDVTEINSLGPEGQITFLFEYGSSEHDLTTNLNYCMSFYPRARVFLERFEQVDHTMAILDKLVVSGFQRNMEIVTDEIWDKTNKSAVIEQLENLAKINLARVKDLSPEYRIAWLLKDAHNENDLNLVLQDYPVEPYEPYEPDEPDNPDEPHMS